MLKLVPKQVSGMPIRYPLKTLKKWKETNQYSIYWHSYDSLDINIVGYEEQDGRFVPVELDGHDIISK